MSTILDVYNTECLQYCAYLTQCLPGFSFTYQPLPRSSSIVGMSKELLRNQEPEDPRSWEWFCWRFHCSYKDTSTRSLLPELKSLWDEAKKYDEWKGKTNLIMGIPWKLHDMVWTRKKWPEIYRFMQTVCHADERWWKELALNEFDDERKKIGGGWKNCQTTLLKVVQFNERVVLHLTKTPWGRKMLMHEYVIWNNAKTFNLLPDEDRLDAKYLLERCRSNEVTRRAWVDAIKTFEEWDKLIEMDRETCIQLVKKVPEVMDKIDVRHGFYGIKEVVIEVMNLFPGKYTLPEYSAWKDDSDIVELVILREPKLAKDVDKKYTRDVGFISRFPGSWITLRFILSDIAVEVMDAANKPLSLEHVPKGWITSKDVVRKFPDLWVLAPNDMKEDLELAKECVPKISFERRTHRFCKYRDLPLSVRVYPSVFTRFMEFQSMDEIFDDILSNPDKVQMNKQLHLYIKQAVNLDIIPSKFMRNVDWNRLTPKLARVLGLSFSLEPYYLKFGDHMKTKYFLYGCCRRWSRCLLQMGTPEIMSDLIFVMKCVEFNPTVAYYLPNGKAKEILDNLPFYTMAKKMDKQYKERTKFILGLSKMKTIQRRRAEAGKNVPLLFGLLDAEIMAKIAGYEYCLSLLPRFN